MKKILGLDLGTNSIGWAVISAQTDENKNNRLNKIEGAGSRIIPMDAGTISDFNNGISKSQTAKRTELRGKRHLIERSRLRRERMNRVLGILDFLPIHYSQALNRYGQIKDGEEPKLAWRKNELGKYEFLFMDSFNEMLEDFRKVHPELIDKKIPYDWTVYYLRKKALTRKISKEELAWILHSFNQKRGYFQFRKEEKESKSKRVEYIVQTVKKVENTEEKGKKGIYYNIYLENGMMYRQECEVFPEWIGKTKELIVTTEINDDGTAKIDDNGNVKRSFRAPKEDDWEIIKIYDEKNIRLSGKTVGAYIYDAILQNPCQKILGQLVRVIDRDFYKEELIKILNKQIELHPELKDKNLYQICIEALYPSNDLHKQNIRNRGFAYLFLDDILFYQRPLKSKKSLISNCPYEEHTATEQESAEKKHYGVKCIAKSHPLYQEFRLWQFLCNLRIYKKGGANDIDVTHELIKTEEDYVKLFEWLNDKKTIKQESLLKYTAFGLKKDVNDYRWNYVEDKEYPCNETRAGMLSYLKKSNIKKNFLTKEIELQLWHILYSVDDKQELTKALNKFKTKHNLSQQFVDEFQKFPPFKKEYGAYSAKAIKKLLPLMRMGKYWSVDNIDPITLDRIEKILSGEFDESIKNRVREKAIHLSEISSFKGLPLWLACYIVYNRHSEAKDVTKWQTPDDIQKYLDSFKQHSLRNPIVEQVITETLRTVRDIWKQYGKIDEIHIELGREMKNPADKRKKMTQQILENEATNLRIKALLSEFVDPEFNIENVRPYSPSQQEILRIYEEGVLKSETNIPEYVNIILKKYKESDNKKRPSKNEVLRYKLWLEQRYRSPYTGQIIPLSKLFTPAYEIEHIIPQALYFDDSLSNKVICESEVNTLKDKMLGYQFIKGHQGRIVKLAFGKEVKIFTEKEYEQFVQEYYGRNVAKKRKLMMESIPDEFIARQLNDSRYISKVIKGLLSNIVREDGEEEAISKNVITCTGGVTDRLKKDWGINDVWNKIVLPRFERMNQITKSEQFTTKNINGQTIPSMPLEYQKGFNKKRIDHRHHAMDAIVIACANRNIVNYLNNESAFSSSNISREDLKKLLCIKSKNDDNSNYKWEIKKPWKSFTQDVYDTLCNIIVSFKQNLRVINKANNVYTRFENGKKTEVKQEGTNWAIRKSMHTKTLYGEVNLRKPKTVKLEEALQNPQRIIHKEFKKKVISLLVKGWNAEKIRKYIEENKDIWQDINLSKIEVYYFTKETNDKSFATRKSLDQLFCIKKTKEDSKETNPIESLKKKIKNSVTDTGIQKILLNHLESDKYKNNPELAFTLDGIDYMNRNILQLNNGHFHQPIYKVRWYENAGKFAVGQNGNKSTKFVEANKGTNLYFAIYETESLDAATGAITKQRSFATIPLNIVIERLKKGLSPVPADDNGNEPKFVLSPNDLVYIPQNGEGNEYESSQIYKFVSCSSNKAHFIPAFVANPIVDTLELGDHNKAQRSWTDEMIKEVCIPIKVDRLGHIIN